MALFAEINNWLWGTFPGSHLDDGYYFLKVESEVQASLQPEHVQTLVDELAKGRFWIVMVGTDEEPLASSLHWERSSIFYNPDWNIMEELPMWATELNGTSVALSDLTQRLYEPSLVAFISPDRKLILHLNLLRLHATNELELNLLKTNFPECFA